MAKINRSTQSGFTLIELIMVIVILSILSAFALPRFVNLKSKADKAVFDGFNGALVSSLGIHKASWIVNGKTSVIQGYSSLTNDSGALVGVALDNIAHEIDCTTIWTDLLDSDDTIIFLSAVNGWRSSYAGGEWAANASQIALLGEASDVYCHFIHTSGLSDSGLSPSLRYNISTGELEQLEWPYTP